MLKALSELCSLNVLTLGKKSKLRAKQGWSLGLNQDVQITVISGSITKTLTGLQRIMDTPRDVHIVFNTMWGDRRIFVFFLAAIALRKKISIVSEPYSPVSHGYLDDDSRVLAAVRKILRPVAYRLAGLLFGSRICAVFAISPLAVTQYKKAGFARGKVVPYGYFIKRSSVAKRRQKSPKSWRVIYVGSMIFRKGYDIAIQAVESLGLDTSELRLDLFGYCARSLELSSKKSRYCGMIQFGGTEQLLASYDLVIVPSRYDGWSVVVNEAINACVPIVAARQVGASAMVSDNRLGIVYDGSSQGLREALKKIVSDQELYLDCSKNCESFGKKIDPSIAASYIKDTLEALGRGSPAPECPWYKA